ncbi:MAG: PAS domain S-box protein [Candidatus Sumerlaeia bacterium]|nr:PAS domain S-box protein [Candidatus Sumerlaeia bacterium]
MLEHPFSDLRALISAIPDLVLVLDRDGRYIEVLTNDNRILIQPAEQLRGKTIYEVFPEELAAQYHAGILKAIETGQPTSREDCLHIGDRQVWVSATASAINDDRVVVVIRDITEQKRAEETLGQREAYFRALIENTSDIIVVQNADRTMRYVSPAVERILGYRPEEIIGRTPSEFIHPDDQQPTRDVLLGLLEKPGATARAEFRLYHKDGSIRICEGIGKNLLHDPAVGGIVESIRDITERRTLEMQLQQAQRLQAIGKLAGGIAHDFNNLLTTILGYCDLMLNQISVGSPLRRDVEEIKKAAGRATSLTQQLLAFARRQILEPKVINLNTIVAEMHKMLSRLIRENIDLVTVLPPGLWRVRADPTQIEQILMNLVLNARDAMPDGGKLTIETANVILDEAYARRHAGVQPGPYVLLAVSDTGCGMDAQTLAQVFEPFFTTKPQGEGTGLGLATVYGIVKQSGGHIWAYSEPGRGTTMKIYLPRVDAPLTVVEDIPASPAVKAGETILVVEDEGDVRNLIAEILKMKGYELLLATRPTEAVEICRTHAGPIHLLVSDVTLPEMNGRTLSEKIVKMRPDIRVLFISGYTENAIVHDGVLEEDVYFLQKPFAPEILLAKVREVLDAEQRWTEPD